MAKALLSAVDVQLAWMAEQLPKGDGWLFEPKWDGFRGVLSSSRAVVVRSRNGKDPGTWVQEIVGAAGQLLAGTVLDGELFAVVDGALSFDGRDVTDS